MKTKKSTYIIHHHPPNFNQNTQKTTTKKITYIIHHHPNPTLSHSQKTFKSFKHENFSKKP